MKLGFGFKKEWFHFSRTFRFVGLLVSVFSFALGNPLLYRAMQYFMNMMNEMATELEELDPSMAGYGDVFTSAAEILGQAEMIFSTTLIELCGTSLLVAMLILMAPCGGEQKKRATIIPICAGLDYNAYLLPKFILYPLTFVGSSFIGGIIAGFMCNALFDGSISTGMIFISSALCAAYLLFILCVYMALGLCTSRPGIMTVSIYLGQSIVQLILSAMGLSKFNPFALYTLISGQMFQEGFSFDREMSSIIVSVALSVVIAVLMYLLTLSVLKAKRVNNQEDKPEF